MYPKRRGGEPKHYEFGITVFSSMGTKAIYTLENKSKVQIYYVIMFKIQWSKVSEMPDTQFKISI